MNHKHRFKKHFKARLRAFFPPGQSWDYLIRGWNICTPIVIEAYAFFHILRLSIEAIEASTAAHFLPLPLLCSCSLLPFLLVPCETTSCSSSKQHTKNTNRYVLLWYFSYFSFLVVSYFFFILFFLLYFFLLSCFFLTLLAELMACCQIFFYELFCYIFFYTKYIAIALFGCSMPFTMLFYYAYEFYN